MIQTVHLLESAIRIQRSTWKTVFSVVGSHASFNIEASFCQVNLMFSLEDEESPSLPEKSLQTPHSTQVTGNTAGYSGSHAPVAHSQGTYLI